MSPAAEEIFSAAMALPESDRLEWAAALLATSEPPVPQLTGEEWLAELNQRSDDSRLLDVAFRPRSEVKARVRGSTRAAADG